jgi:hypothetical protein
MAKVRFVFGKDMSDEQMWEAFKKMAMECGFQCKDTHKKKVVSKKASPKKAKKRIKG